MTSPIIVDRSPCPVEVEEGKKYFWCSCGKSQKQPFCDGAHKGSEFSPVAFVAEKTETIFLCMCKHSCHAPRCDGSHSGV